MLNLESSCIISLILFTLLTSLYIILAIDSYINRLYLVPGILCFILMIGFSELANIGEQLEI